MPSNPENTRQITQFLDGLRQHLTAGDPRYEAHCVFTRLPEVAPYPSIAVRLSVVATSRWSQQRISALALGESVPCRPSPTELVQWSTDNLQLEKPGLLARLRDAGDPILEDCVHHLIRSCIEQVVAQQYCSHPAANQSEIAGELVRVSIERKWCERYDPSRASLYTFVRARIRPKALPAVLRRMLGLEPEKGERSPGASDDPYERVEDKIQTRAQLGHTLWTPELYLSYFLELNDAEAARRLGVSRSTFTKRRRKQLEELRSRVDSRRDEEDL